ncbi:MAG: MjaI restriction endonuclease [Candidatus Argoarchaeum ethanivorans]|uniref:MjaI restriction endonuclease n=1 Tax=Candidatus Argoarchaeum ethanivorans TaxID=2608793 RepID=A0A811T5T4_9EURY|nr:MAG: MjaI restriction endonuclease [Candidatus Argoarchaeum ethanivorans]
MAKEWILNSAMNRFQLNFKRNVGAVSEAIRKCAPKTIEEWNEYYFKNVRTKEHIEDLGRKLYIKITEVISAEVEAITEEDCIGYMVNMVIARTFDGYMTEIKTIYGQLEGILNMKIQPAPDEWDRLYNVDFFIKINDKYIGLQIKPAGDVSHIPQIFKEHSIQEATHKKFTEKYGGKVFYIISIKEGGKKKIHNVGVITEIEQEIERLQKWTIQTKNC